MLPGQLDLFTPKVRDLATLDKVIENADGQHTNAQIAAACREWVRAAPVPAFAPIERRAA